ncbi:MAG: hypothetical protein JSV24_11080 [Bacteroidales bacterium]|nr:MAG: hypothetical protein JSV24_11080 [Bacteroidales bacterium]
MEKNVGIWLDNEKAYIITLVNGNEHVEKIESNVETRVRFKGETKSYSRLGGMFINPQKKKTKRKNHQLKEYFNSILKRTRDANGIYIFGPADAKKNLKKVYQREKSFTNKLKGVESSDRLTENQMVARVKKVFKVA